MLMCDIFIMCFVLFLFATCFGWNSNVMARRRWLSFLHIVHIFSLFDLPFFHVFHIFSLFNLLVLHIFHLFSLFNLLFFCNRRRAITLEFHPKHVANKNKTKHIMKISHINIIYDKTATSQQNSD
jgi:hypothetical protein